MLNQADAELVRHDPDIPGLHLLLDPIAFARKIKELWPQLTLKKIEPTLLRYQYGQWCVASFRLTTPDSTIRVYAKAHGNDASLKLLEAKARSYAAGDEGMTARILSDFGVIIYAFPNDQKLTSLTHILTEDSQYDLLRSLFPTQATWWTGTIEPIHYSPERYLVATLKVDQKPQAIIKLLVPDNYHAAKESAQQQIENEHFKRPVLIGSSAEYHALGFTYLPGIHLNKIFAKDQSHADKGVERAGRLLNKFHQQSLADMSELSIKDRATEIDEIKQQAEALAGLSPFLKAPATQLADIMIEQLERYPEARTITHGHFIDRHILIANQHTALLDLDNTYIGDAHADIGFFIAHIERSVLRGKLNSQQAQNYRQLFLQAYGEAPRERVELYTAIGLFKMATHPFQYREVEWLHQINTLLKRARRIMININEKDSLAAALAF